MCNKTFASVGCAYVLWFFFGLFGAHVRHAALGPAKRCQSAGDGVLSSTHSLPYALQRFYVGRPISGLVWLFTLGLFGVGWVIDVFLIPEFVEEHNKKVFHQQMLETGNSLLFDGEPYGVSVCCANATACAP
jgi:TM2 domain-containing membrane protein YozV